MSSWSSRPVSSAPARESRSAKGLRPDWSPASAVSSRPEPFDEATVEHYLSRILRLRATFSDAQSLTARTPFRRIERAGIDLLVFLSF